MQYYLNGFKPGDPMDHSATGHEKPAPSLVDLPAEVDVLIVGCGPAGLTLATQLAAFPDISTRIIEQKAGPLLVGQPDLNANTLNETPQRSQARVEQNDGGEMNRDMKTNPNGWRSDTTVFVRDHSVWQQTKCWYRDDHQRGQCHKQSPVQVPQQRVWN
jgi:hypothetical protein